jgi:hypothetical protein
MAEDLTIQILRQIQEKLADVQETLSQHDRDFGSLRDQMNRRFDASDLRIGELVDSTIKALGTSSIANVRHDSVQHHLAEVELELRELRSRLKRLEERV